MSAYRQFNRAVALALAALVLIAPISAEASGFNFGSTKFFVQDEELPVCLSNYQVRQAVAAAGYSDIFLNVPNDDHIQVKASQAGSVYLIDFNRCTGRIEQVALLR